MSTNRGRNEVIDVVKGIGILLMVMRHARFPYSDFVLLFHMAIFFIASGYLYKPLGRNGDMANFVIRKIKTLWKPYFITNMIFVLSNNLLLNCGIYIKSEQNGLESFASSRIYGLVDILKSVLMTVGFQLNTNLGGATWFYGTLFGVIVLYALVDFTLSYINSDFTKKIVRMSIVILFAIIGWLCMLTGHALRGMDRVFSVYPLIEIGHLFREYNIMNRLKGSQKVLTVLLSLIALTIGYQFGNIALVNNEIVNPGFFLLMSIAGWFGLWIIATVVVRFEYAKKLFELFSRRAVWIIGGHFLAFKIVTLVQIITMKMDFTNLAAFPVFMSGFVWSTFYTLVGLGCPLLIYFYMTNSLKKLGW